MSSDPFEILEERIKKAVILIDKLKLENQKLAATNEEMSAKVSSLEDEQASGKEEMEGRLAELEAEKEAWEKERETVRGRVDNILQHLAELE